MANTCVKQRSEIFLGCYLRNRRGKEKLWPSFGKLKKLHLPHFVGVCREMVSFSLFIQRQVVAGLIVFTVRGLCFPGSLPQCMMNAAVMLGFPCAPCRTG